MNLEIEYFEPAVGQRSTVAKVVVYVGDHKFAGVGEALRMQDDKPSDEVGSLLAVGRALEHAGRKMQKRGLGIEKMLTDNRMQSRQAKRHDQRQPRRKNPFRRNVRGQREIQGV